MTGRAETFLLSGRQFAALVLSDLEDMNTGLTKTSMSKLGKMSGLSGRRLGQLLNTEQSNAPNPTSLTMRLVLFTLGYEIPNPEDDVIPELRRKGVYSKEVHGAPRRKLCAKKVTSAVSRGSA